MTIDELEPTLLWQYFKALTQIPRPSYHEEAIRQFVLDEAARLGLSAEMDDAGNIVVCKPASQGKERAPGVILQSHLDMVPQKNSDKVHDFTKDPIQTLVKGDWLTADGTTLGADNGIGVAAALAILADNKLTHGPIEALFTATEESGMDGAKGLRKAWLQGDILLNLDSEDEGELYIGCAGGVDATLSFPLHKIKPPTGYSYTLRLSGLAGGHSGLNIIDQRGNANILMAQLLHRLSNEYDFSLVDFSGGNLRNAIPREAQAIIVCAADESELRESIERITTTLRCSLGEPDKAFSVALTPAQPANMVLDEAGQRTLLTAILLCPNGVIRMNHDMAGLVETSSNLAIVDIEQDTLVLKALLRSSNDDAKADLASRMDLFTQALNGQAEFDGDYPGWQPNPSSDIVKLMLETGQEVFGQIPPLKAIHAGLECGILGEHYPHWQIASFGPTITGAHSPDEQVYIPSVDTFWKWLTMTLERLAHIERDAKRD